MANVIDNDTPLILIADEGKKCSRCGKEKPIWHFYRNNDPKSKDSLQSWCKTCHREYKQERRQLEIIHKCECEDVTLKSLVKDIPHMDSKKVTDTRKALKAVIALLGRKKCVRRKRTK